jgi:hypothetical protein
VRSSVEPGCGWASQADTLTFVDGMVLPLEPAQVACVDAPALLNGVAMSFIMTVTVNFSL